LQALPAFEAEPRMRCVPRQSLGTSNPLLSLLAFAGLAIKAAGPGGIPPNPRAIILLVKTDELVRRIEEDTRNAWLNIPTAG